MPNIPRRYTIGADLCTPYIVTLEINATEVTIEQFRADLPRLAAKLESYLLTTRAEAARTTGG